MYNFIFLLMRGFLWIAVAFFSMVSKPQRYILLIEKVYDVIAIISNDISREIICKRRLSSLEI